ncbi:Fido domain-containing protein [Klenkia terrae]|uniref:Fic family protein n=1 Tax=Klenkia terrae TaxID=1052259 RepID=UPI00176F6F99|nr:Fic family protein [Klenkia terrae]SSC23510.1 Fido domain-containing protein [Klenkia terrae]
MPRLFAVPDLDLDDHAAIAGVHQMRADLASVLRAPRRWQGGLRKTSQARAIQGSNSIEGYSVSTQDAAAAVEDEAPLTADQKTWAEILGYRRVLTYVLNVATLPGFLIDEATLKALHFMLLEHDLRKGPGQYRQRAIYVRDDIRDVTVYEGPDSDDVPALMASLVESLERYRDADPLVRGALAHLNLVMIHPFRDGNGRMARALQTMTLAQDDVIEPVFSSIEEWLGANTTDYYRVLAATGQGSWHPENDAHLWVKFNVRAHHMQAQTLRRRFDEAERTWVALDELTALHKLPDRVANLLFEAFLGLRVQRSTYIKHTNLEKRTATRDLAQLTDRGLLDAVGQTRGRYYVAGDELRELRAPTRPARRPVDDPFPGLMDQIPRVPVQTARTVTAEPHEGGAG